LNESTRWTIDVTESTFEAEVIERSRTVPIIVDFWAEWCQPCQVLGPMLEEIVAKHEGKVILAKVDLDQEPGLATHFGVQSIPMVVAFRDGDPVNGFAGVQPKEEIEQFVDGLVPTAADGLVEAAHEATDDDDAAAEKLRKAIELEPDNARAALALAELQLARGAAGVDEARSLVEGVESGGDHEDVRRRVEARLRFLDRAVDLADEPTLRARADDAASRCDLGCRLAADGRYADALAELLAAAELDKSLARERVKLEMVDVFAIIGQRSELADDYRARLTRLLY